MLDKILLLSDIHGNYNSLVRILCKHSDVRFILVAGDVLLNKKQIDELKLICVKGNSDYLDLPKELSLDINNQKIFLTHGHLYDVKYSLNKLINKAQTLDAKIVVFGHTHRPYINKHNDILFLNPGTLRPPKQTYIIYERDQAKLYELSN